MSIAPFPASKLQLRRLDSFMPLLVFLFVTSLFALGSYHAFQQVEELVQAQKLEDLNAIADMKVAQLVAWHEKHRKRGMVFARGTFLAEEFERWQQEGMPPNERKKKISHLLTNLQSVYGYETVLLFDRNGVARISADGNITPDPDDTALALQVMGARKEYFSDLHRRPRSNQDLVMDLATPLLSDKGGQVVGAMLLLVDPRESLFPLIQSWPTHSQSAETLISRRDGDDVLFLNDLRHLKNAALTLRKPLSTPDLPSAMVFRGGAGSMEGVDYRGVPVVAAARKVPGTPWVLVAKIDKEELFAPVVRMEQWALGMGFAFIAIGSALVFVWLRAYLARYRHLQAQYQAAVEREALERRFEHLAKQANDIILVTDETARIVDANDRAEEAYGYTREELVKMHLGDLRPTTEDPAALAGLLEQIKEQGALRYEALNLRKDGTVFPVEVSIRVIEVAGAKYIQGIARDITERKRAEEELRFRGEIIAHMDEGVLLTRNLDGLIAYANPKAEQMFGYEPEELIGQHISIVNAPGDKSPEQTAEEIMAALAKNGAWEGEVFNRKKDGSTFWCYATVTSFEHHAYGSVWVSVHRDITELKELQALRNRHQLEMEHVQRLNIANEMTYGLSHELSQPLTAAHTYIDACLRRLEGGEYDAEKQIKCLSLAHMQTERAGKVINHFKGLINKGDRELAPLEVNSLIHNTVDFLEYEIRRNGITVDFDLAALPSVWACGIEIEQVLLNLIKNAIEAMKEAPVRALRLTGRPAEEGGIVVEVGDSGAGMSADELERIFDQFYTTKSDGLGLGLAICQTIVKAHNGKIWASSVPGRGSTFSFSLPEGA